MTRVVRYYPRALGGDGGMTTAVHQWSLALSRLGVQVAVAYDRDDTTRRPPDDGVEWLPVRHRGRHAAATPVDLAGHLRGADLLVLHSGWTRYNLVAGAEARRRGVPYLLEPRGAYDPHILRRKRAVKRLWWVTAERRLVAQAAGVHLFFPSELDHLRRLGFDGPVVVAPNGVSNPYAARWDGGSGGTVLWLGRFDPQHKGLDLLLGAVRALPAAQRPRVLLRGPDWRGRKRRVADLVDTLGLSTVVTVGPAAYAADKFALMSTARAFVYPSRWEAFGNSVAEAATVGVPVLTTRFPLGRYLAEHGAAVACDPSPAALAEGLRRVTGPDAAALGRSARRVAGTVLTWDRAARAWLSQVERLL